MEVIDINNNKIEINSIYDVESISIKIDTSLMLIRLEEKDVICFAGMNKHFLKEWEQKSEKQDYVQ